MKPFLSSLLLWCRIIRPQTLFASLVPVLVGAYSVSINGLHFSCAVCLVTACCALSLQVLSNLVNDYYDFLRGSDAAGRVGYKRALAEGEVSVDAMRRACLVAAAVACLLGSFLIYVGGWAILCIGVSALLFAWLYTATPYSLSYLGIADIFVFLYYGVIASCGTSYLLLCPDMDFLVMQDVLRDSFLLGGVCGLISVCVLLINNIRDADTDREAGKKTLPVRFGRPFALALMFVVICLMPLFAYLVLGFSPSLLVFVPCLLIWLKMLKAEGTTYNKCLLFTGMTNLLFFFLCLLSS